MALRLQASGDLDGLREVALVGDLHNVPPAALEVLGEDRRDVLDFRGAWRRRSLVLRLHGDRLLAPFCDQLTAERLALNRSIKCAENAATVAELSRVAVGVDLSLLSRPFLRHFRFVVVVELVSSFLVFVVCSLISVDLIVDQVILDDLRHFRQRVVGL